jgi:L-ascorbate metabolism protein UlaG (beta-lactamase superfamily)
MKYYSGPITDHFDGKRFFTAGLPSTDKSLFDLLRWQLFGKHSKWPQVVPARSGIKPEARVDGLTITHVGHASLLIQTGGINILVDPVWADRASPLKAMGPRRRNPPAIAFADLPQIHAVLVSHNHYDHMDTATIGDLWQAHRPTIVSSLGNDAVIHRDASDAAIKTGDWWQNFQLSDRVRVTIVPAYHWSARKLGDRRLALWSGFMIETPSGLIYCAGDTAYQDGKIFAEIRKRCGAPLVAILPIGAYEPRWFMSTQHTDPAEAVQIATDVGAQYLLGVHWGTFALTDEPWDEPPKLLAQAIAERRSGINALAFLSGDVWSPQS